MLSRAKKHGNGKRWISLLLAVILVVSIFPLPIKAVDYSDSDRIIVSLGDSYSSGEGIEDFYGQEKVMSERVQDLDWLAHRSQNSWPGMLTLPGVTGTMAKNRNTHWYFAAVSGATTADIARSEDYASQLAKWLNAPRQSLTLFRELGLDKFLLKSYDKTAENGQQLKGSKLVSFQLDIFEQLKAEGKKADYVTLTLGGNDADFSGIVKSVVTGSTYLNLSGLSDKLEDTWDKFYAEGGIRDKLYHAYGEIAESAGPQAHIIVAGYPQLLDSSGEGFFVSQEEATLVNTEVSKFNDAIKLIVEECESSGMKICFVPVEGAFEGHEAYSDDPYIKEVIFGPKLQAQDLQDVGLSSSYSMHPNYKGACKYAECVQREIDKLEAIVVDLGPEMPYEAVNTNSEWYIYGSDGQLYDDYTLRIYDKHSLSNYVHTGPVDEPDPTITEYVVNSAEPLSVSLEVGFAYTFEFIDNKNPDNIEIELVGVTNNDPKLISVMELATDFGGHSPISQDASASYKTVLDMYYNSILNHWSDLDRQGWEDATDPDSVSYLISAYMSTASLSDIGYMFADLDGNGQQELLISTFDDAASGLFYDLYTVRNGKVIHLVSGGERDRYYLAVDHTINNSGSSSASCSVDINYRLETAEGKLKINQAVIYDSEEDANNPWFYATAEFRDEKTYALNRKAVTPISQAQASAYIAAFPKNAKLSLTPFDQYTQESTTRGEVLVSDAFSDYGIRNDGGVNNYRIPKINISGDAAEKTNAAIYKDLYDGVYQKIKNRSGQCGSSGITYAWTESNGIVSILARWSPEDYTGHGPIYYKAYNASSKTGATLSLEQLTQAYGLSVDGFYALAKEKAEALFDQINGSLANTDWAKSYYAEYKANMISDKNIRNAIPFISESGDLCIIADIYYVGTMVHGEGPINLTGDSSPKVPEFSWVKPEEEPEDTLSDVPQDIGITGEYFIGTVSEPDAGAVSISTPQELVEKLTANPAGSYVLACDIDLGTYNGGVWVALDNFSGVLDGQGHVIRNLKVTSYTDAGLFLDVEDAVFKDLGIEAIEVSAGECAGVVSATGNATFVNCYVICPKVCAEEAMGGLIGLDYEDTTKLRQVYVDVSMSAKPKAYYDSAFGEYTVYCYAGGIVGCGTVDASDIVVNCDISIIGEGEPTSGEIVVGGVLGDSVEAKKISIVDADVNCSVSVKTARFISWKTTSSGRRSYDNVQVVVGGLIGEDTHDYGSGNFEYSNKVTISGCTLSVNLDLDVYGVAIAGGFIGNEDGLNKSGMVVTIENCSLTGTIHALCNDGSYAKAGGVFGYHPKNMGGKNTVEIIGTSIQCQVKSKGGYYFTYGGTVSGDGNTSIALENCSVDVDLHVTPGKGDVYIDGEMQ